MSGIRSEWSGLRRTYTKSGLTRFEAEVMHSGLNRYQVVRGDSSHVVAQKARAKMAQWDDAWSRKLDVELQRRDRHDRAREKEQRQAEAATLTEEAGAALRELDGILQYTLGIDDAVDWESLKDRRPFAEPKPRRPPRRSPPTAPDPREEPRQQRPKYQPQLSLLDRIVPPLRRRREAEAKRRFDRDRSAWASRVEQYERELADQAEHERQVDQAHERALSTWEERRSQFLEAQELTNAAVDRRRDEYEQRSPDAIADYCDLVLTRSRYPDRFPKTFEIEYRPDARLVVVEYDLPEPDSMPVEESFRYVASRDEIVPKLISEPQRRRTYDRVILEVALRSIHELLEADLADALGAVAFNGYVRGIDKATGNPIRPCIVSLLVKKDEFLRINLASVDPKQCFRKLKGIAGASLHAMSAVAPVVQMNREDSRFVDGYAVVDAIQEGDNLAAMDWQDFEHLVRELFEKEFAASGGEVKVTRASRDGGVDAVIFDPDPIRGGKIVVQAKRYTNTVPVGHVRDLYGAVLNEGAMKGILVTTSDFGPDAHAFAKDKPLVLVSGGGLLHMLERHGHRARIDLAEAKERLREQ